MIEPPPVLLLLGPDGHGVVQYAADMAAAVRRHDARVEVVGVAAAAHARDAVAGRPRVHLHATDRILGDSPEQAAALVEELAGATRLTLTLHDLPQDSDGTGRQRRVAAYTRMLAAAEGVVVNSEHERMLVAEHLPGAPSPAVIPLGARRDAASVVTRPDRVELGLPERSPRDLVVLISGYVYPGKGHTAAIDAAADAVTLLRDRGADVGEPVVRALGRASDGHESDVRALAARAAERGVRWELTGYLSDARFAAELAGEGIPLAAHEHISASRTILDWSEAGRCPLVLDSRYAREGEALRPGTMRRYAPADLPRLLAEAWERPQLTRLPAGAGLAPTLADAAEEYLAWWHGHTAA